ncbi:hypothetical protein TcCL_ESM10770 [Trypanosoma cruzi]|nr:hypothetical protein TcCL_ESM10770 [Trypanosoma cruzi]
MMRSLPFSVGMGDQQPVASVMKRRRRSLFHIEYPRLCFLRVWSAGVLGTFGGDLCARRLLGRRWRHCGIRMRGVLRPLEHQDEHVRQTPSYCGRTSALCRRSGKATLIRCSSFYEELPSARQVEVPEAGAGRSPR